jgi:hypothetical protein
MYFMISLDVPQIAWWRHHISQFGYISLMLILTGLDKRWVHEDGDCILSVCVQPKDCDKLTITGREFIPVIPIYFGSKGPLKTYGSHQGVLIMEYASLTYQILELK